MTKNGMNRQQLPIDQKLAEIVATVKANPVTIVQAGTGAGKSTRIPPALLRALPGRIAQTQPRRMAVRAIAGRIAAEIGCEVGQEVGFRLVTHESKLSKATRLTLLIDQSLTNEFLRDPELSKWDIVIVDEAHLRSIQIDILLGMLKGLVERRPNLRVVVTSATIDTQKFSAYFNGAPIIDVPGKLYEIETRWAPLEQYARGSEHYLGRLSLELKKLYDSGVRGKVLIFVPGKAEIEEVISGINRLQLSNVSTMPLHGQMDSSEQDQVFAPIKAHELQAVVCTEIAETSLTVPGVVAVIDSLRVRRRIYDRGVGFMDTLVVARDAATQRKGRAGRVAAGIYVPLCSQDEWNKMLATSQPELLRMDPAEAVLTVEAADLAIDQFPWLDRPNAAAMTAAVLELQRLGALNQDGRITDLGRSLAKLPIEPELGKLMVTAAELGVLPEAAIAAAIIANEGIFYSPKADEPALVSDLTIGAFANHPNLKLSETEFPGIFKIDDYSWDAKKVAEQIRTWLAGDSQSDFVASVGAFQLWQAAKSSQRGKVARQLSLNNKSCWIVRDTLDQLRENLWQAGFGASAQQRPVTPERAEALAIALATSLVNSIAVRKSEFSREYRNHDGEFELSWRSVCQPKAIVVHGKLNAVLNKKASRRGTPIKTNISDLNCEVKVRWLIERCPQLVEFTEGNDYRWDASRDAVVCTETVSFTTLVVEQRQKVVVHDQAAKAFAYAIATKRTGFACEAANQAVIAELEAFWQRSSGTTPQPTTEQVTAWYVERLGGATTKAEAVERELLFRFDEFVSDELVAAVRHNNPDAVLIGDVEICEVSYQWKPADSWNDRPATQTITIKVSATTIRQLAEAGDQAAVENLVPSGASYVLKLVDEDYTAISGTDVAELCKQIEARRLELAWEVFHNEHPATRVEIKGLEPLPELPQPELYDEQTTTLAFPALYASYSSWYQQWFRTQNEAQTSQAAAITAKAKLDAEEDERRNFDVRLAEAQVQLTEVEQQFAQIDLMSYQAYGLSEKEAGKAYWSSDEDLAKKIEQAKGMLGGYYTPQPAKALELLATLRARIIVAFDYQARNVGLKDKATAWLNRLTAINQVYRELKSALPIEGQETFEKAVREVESHVEGGRYLPAVDQCELVKELLETLEKTKQALDVEIASGRGLLNFRAWHRRGGSNNGDAWVVRPDGSLRENDTKECSGRYDGWKTWHRVHADELVLQMTKGHSADPYICTVVFRPTTLTQAQQVAVRTIEESDLYLPVGTFGLDQEVRERQVVRLAAIKLALTRVLAPIPEFDYQLVVSTLGVAVQNSDSFNRRLPQHGSVSSESCDGREAMVLWHANAADGIVEVVTYRKYGYSNYAFRWRETVRQGDKLEPTLVASPTPVVEMVQTQESALTAAEQLAALKAQFNRR